jgi:hypothetical protein
MHTGITEIHPLQYTALSYCEVCHPMQKVCGNGFELVVNVRFYVFKGVKTMWKHLVYQILHNQKPGDKTLGDFKWP